MGRMKFLLVFILQIIWEKQKERESIKIMLEKQKKRESIYIYINLFIYLFTGDHLFAYCKAKTNNSFFFLHTP